MLIDAIDVYWVRIPLAFVWKTSYADQHYTDTIFVRMAEGGRHAWGESCPPYIPAYSAEHTLATFHTVREHMAGRLVGRGLGGGGGRVENGQRSDETHGQNKCQLAHRVCLPPS